MWTSLVTKWDTIISSSPLILHYKIGLYAIHGGQLLILITSLFCAQHKAGFNVTSTSTEPG